MPEPEKKGSFVPEAQGNVLHARSVDSFVPETQGNVLHACSVVGRGCLNFILLISYSSCSAFLRVYLQPSGNVSIGLASRILTSLLLHFPLQTCAYAG